MDDTRVYRIRAGSANTMWCSFRTPAAEDSLRVRERSTPSVATNLA